MAKFGLVLLFCSVLLLLVFLASPSSAQGRPPAKGGHRTQPAQDEGEEGQQDEEAQPTGRAGHKGKQQQEEEEGEEEEASTRRPPTRGGHRGRPAHKEPEDDEGEGPSLSSKLLNTVVSYLGDQLPKISTEDVVDWVKQRFGMDDQSSRKTVSKAQEIVRRREQD